MKKSALILLILALCSPLIAQEAALAPSANIQTALDMMLDGDFQQGLDLLSPEAGTQNSAVAAKASALVSEYLEHRRTEELQRSEELATALGRARSLLEIAALAENGEGTFADVRKSLEDVREVLIDLLAAPKIEENIQPGDWMQQRMVTDRAAMESHFDRVRAMLADNDGRHAAAVIAGISEFLASYDKFVEAAAALDYSSVKSAANSVTVLDSDSMDLAISMDDLMALVSEMPWRDALDRFLQVRLIAFDDPAIMDTQLARDIFAGAEKQAAAYCQDGEYYKALRLYGLLDDIFGIENDTRYKEDINRVTSKALMMSLYTEPQRKNYSDDEAGLKRYEKQLASYTDDWNDHIRGVDFYMVRVVLARISEYYVDVPDFNDMLTGGLEALERLVSIPRIGDTFGDLANAQARKIFLNELDSIRRQAAEVGRLDHRMVGRSLNRILWVNRRSVNLPDEVIDVEFTNGMLGRLDRFSTMIWPNEWKEFRKQITGNFKGVGIQIRYQRETDYIAVISPLENSPAFRAGIEAGDLIVKIDGEDAKGIDTNEAVETITGPAGSKVVLTIKRPGRTELMDFELTREEINVHTLMGWKRLDGGDWDWMIDPSDGIGYCRITNFTKDTVPAIKKAVAAMQMQGVKGIIMDMRGNPGGMLDAAIGVTDEFVREGQIVSTRGRQPEESFSATQPGGFEEGSLVVLVDESSASAAEIVSGALKDLGRSITVGRRSFGKGSVQYPIAIKSDPTGDNAAYLKLTTAHYYLPSGRCLHRLDGAASWGVEPDVDCAMTPRQTRQRLTVRNRTEIIKQWDADKLEADLAEQLEADIQLRTALLVCKLDILAKEAKQAETLGQGGLVASGTPAAVADAE